MGDRLEMERLGNDHPMLPGSRKFILTLGRRDAEQCSETMVRVKLNPHLHCSQSLLTTPVDQALATRNLPQTPEKQVFFDTLRRPPGKHMVLPDTMVIRDELGHGEFSLLLTSYVYSSPLSSSDIQ